MKIGQKIVTCRYDSSVTQAKVNANQENTGYFAVSLVGDNNFNHPVPEVKLSSNVADQIYGAVATFDSANQRCGVITTGIVPIKKDGNSAAGDLTRGIVPTTTEGKVALATTAGNGRGTVVNRVDSSEILWVDLDVDNNAVSQEK